MVDSRIVADDHSVETKITTQDVVQYHAVSHTLLLLSCHRMIARHHSLAACQTDHSLVRHQDVFHQHFLIGITSSAIAEVVFRTGSYALAQVTLLQATHKGHTHRCRQVSVLAIRLLQTIETRRAAYIDHG